MFVSDDCCWHEAQPRPHTDAVFDWMWRSMYWTHDKSDPMDGWMFIYACGWDGCGDRDEVQVDAKAIRSVSFGPLDPPDLLPGGDRCGCCGKPLMRVQRSDPRRLLVDEVNFRWYEQAERLIAEGGRGVITFEQGVADFEDWRERRSTQLSG